VCLFFGGAVAYLSQSAGAPPSAAHPRCPGPNGAPGPTGPDGEVAREELEPPPAEAGALWLTARPVEGPADAGAGADAGARLVLLVDEFVPLTV
jgi:hypothetical protein